MIGEKIRKIRTFKGYSQEYVSDLLRISQAAYSDIENNKTKINLERIQELAAIFNVAVNDLLNFEDNQIFNTTFKNNAKGFFKINKVIKDFFDKEREAYLRQIAALNDEIAYLRKKLDERK